MSVSSLLSFLYTIPVDHEVPQLEIISEKTKIQNIAFSRTLTWTACVGLFIINGMILTEASPLSHRVDQYCENSCVQRHLITGINEDGSFSMQLFKKFATPLFYQCAHSCEALFRNWCLSQSGFTNISDVCTHSSTLQHLDLNYFGQTPYLTSSLNQSQIEHYLQCGIDAKEYCVQMNQYDHCFQS